MFFLLTAKTAGRISKQSHMKKLFLGSILALSLAAVAQAEIYQIGLNTTTPSDWLLTGPNDGNTSTATGGPVGSGIYYDNSTQQLFINVAYGIFGFTPLQGTYSASHLHFGAAGVSGPVVVDLSAIHSSVGPNAGIYAGSVQLNATLESELYANQLYMNIHSSAFPGGEIRGQLVPTAIPEPTTWLIVSAGLGTLILLRRRN